jgi:hypothetical protein
MTRVAAVLAVLLGVLGGVFTVLAPAGALGQSPVTLDHAGRTKVDYPAIAGDSPGSTDPVDLLSPDTCAAAGCDYIPLDIKTPTGLSPNGDWFVQVTLSWETQQVDGVPLEGSLDSDDMDLWIAGDPVVADAGPNQDGFTYYSAGTSQPEKVTMYQPAGKWSLYVVNASGVNTGYSLTFDVITDNIPSTIFESLPPSFSGSGYLDTPTTTTPPPPAVVAPAPKVDIRPATPPRPDSSFTSTGSNDSALSDQLASPALPRIVRASASRPSAPSNLALLSWLVAFPLAIFALAGAVLLRRQRSLIIA